MERLWYAVYTRPKNEKRVADLLERKSIEHYCPLHKVQKQWSDRKKVSLQPLFTSYVFVRLNGKELITVRETDGVINLVHWLSKPAVIRDEEIEAIKRFLNEHETVTLEKQKININDHVRISAGPLMMHEGRVVEIMHKTIKVSLPSLGYAMLAEVPLKNIEKLSVPYTGSYAQAL